MSHVLVTGGTGFIGGHLVRQLIDNGNSVCVLTRSVERARKNLPASTHLLEGDVTDPLICREAVSGAKTVFHLAAAHQEPGIRDERYHEVHVEGTRHLLEASKSEGVERFVHCSTVGVIGNVGKTPADETWPHKPEEVYQSTKSEAEMLALKFHRETGLPVVVARPTATYGPHDMRLLKLFKMINSGRFVMLGSGNVNYHMVFIDDAVRALCLLAEHPDAVGEVFNLAGSEYCTLNNLVRLIADELGVSPPRLRLPAWPVQVIGSVVEKVCIPLGVEPPIYRRRVDFFTKNRAFSIDKIRDRLQFEPSTTLKAGIMKTIEWYRSHSLLPEPEPTVVSDKV